MHPFLYGTTHCGKVTLLGGVMAHYKTGGCNVCKGFFARHNPKLKRYRTQYNKQYWLEPGVKYHPKLGKDGLDPRDYQSTDSEDY